MVTARKAIEEMIAELNTSGQERYAKTFAALSRSFAECFPCDDFAIADTDSRRINDFLTFLASKNLKINTIKFYHRAFRALCSRHIGKPAATALFRDINIDAFKPQTPEPKGIITPKPTPIDNEPHWFASKMFDRDLNRIKKVVSEITDDIYVPVLRNFRRENHKIVEVTKPLCQLMFFRCNTNNISNIASALRSRIMIYTTVTRDGRRPSIISDHEMNMFRLVTDTACDSLEYFTEDLQKFRQGQRVRVIAGDFEGAEGTIVRIKKDRRLVVTITGVCAVATPHLHPSLLEEI